MVDRKFRIQMTPFFFLIFSLWFAACGLSPAFANNIAVENVSLVDQVAGSNTYDIQFDISWENSWRIAGAPTATANWDAAWVFAKYSVYSGGSWGDWGHCTLKASGSPLPTGFSAGSGTGLTINVPTDKMGGFLYRSSAGSGSTLSTTDIEFVWDYGTDIGDDDDAIIRIKVSAIEMVLIPEGSFALHTGDDANLIANFQKADGSISNEGALSEGDITWDRSESSWCGAQNSDGSIGGCAALGANYPKGYQTIYCMKYEISQGQYADFLSLLTDAQDGNRYPNTSSYRHTISGSYGSYSASVPDRACNYLQWADGLAYADWAGLRPLTELEYEKICRGQETADIDYAWGSTTISGLETGTGNRVQNDGLPNESSTSSSDNCHYNNSGAWNDGGGPYGPVRCGFFAESGTSRETSGAGYYGVMEMSGNLWERCITVAKYCWNNSTWNNLTNAGSFDGRHGNGVLSSTGFADVTNWPSRTATSGYTAYGAGFRGGGWSNSSSHLRVSYRYLAAYPSATRSDYYGFRCARTP